VKILKSDAMRGDTDIKSEQLRLIKARARRAELEVLELTKILVPAKDVKDAAFETARRVRDALLNIPDRLAALLAAEQDRIRAHELLTKEIRSALERLDAK